MIRNLKRYHEHNEYKGEFLYLPYLGVRPRLAYHLGYYDGILSGVCYFNDQKYFFQIADEISYEEYYDEDGEQGWDSCAGRRYVVLQIPPEYLEAIEVRHSLFQQFVGYHTDYDENNGTVGGTHPQSEWDKFYDWAKTNPYPPRDLTKEIAVAWFGFPLQENEPL